MISQINAIIAGDKKTSDVTYKDRILDTTTLTKTTLAISRLMTYFNSILNVSTKDALKRSTSEQMTQKCSTDKKDTVSLKDTPYYYAEKNTIIEHSKN